MTVSSVKVEPLKDIKFWFKVTVKSQNLHGETSTEMLCSEEVLRQFKQEISKAQGEKPDYSELPENIKRFMGGE